MSQEMNVSRLLLETVISNTDTIGKLKGHIELLEEKMLALAKAIDVSDDKHVSVYSSLLEDASESLDIVKEISIKLQNTPISKLVERLSDSDKLNDKLISTLVSKMDKFLNWIGEQDKLREDEKIRGEKIKGEKSKIRWGAVATIVSAFLAQAGLLLGMLLK